MCFEVGISGSPHKMRGGNVQEANGSTGASFSTQGVVALWEWQHKDGWLPFDAPICNKLESAWASNVSRYSLSVEGHQYDINFQHMWQQNCSYHTTRHIRRSTKTQAPAWYWWGNGVGHRITANLSLLAEAEYQKFVSEKPHRNVVWTDEEREKYTLNVSAMQLTRKTRRESYPLCRVLIKADALADADSESESTVCSQEERLQAVFPPPAINAIDSSSYKRLTSSRGAETGSSSVSTETTACGPSSGSVATPSIRISLQSGVNIEVAQGASTTLHVTAPYQQQQWALQRQSRQPSENNIFLPMVATSNFSTCSETPICCSCCTPRRCDSRCRCVEVSCCNRRECCSCRARCCSSPPKRLCSADPHEPECVEPSVPQQVADPSPTETATAQIQEDSTTTTTTTGTDSTAREENCLEIPTSSVSGSANASSGCVQQQEAPQLEATEVDNPTTVGEQQLLRRQQDLDRAHSQLLLRQEEHLARNARLEQQQEALLQQQQQFVNKLQLQQEELLQKQEEVRELQSQLEQQHADQMRLLLKQAEDAQKLWPTARDDAASPCDEQQENASCSVEDNRGMMDDRQEEPLSKGGEASAESATGVPSRTPFTEGGFQSPVDDERTSDDEYTCV